MQWWPNDCTLSHLSHSLNKWIRLHKILIWVYIILEFSLCIILHLFKEKSITMYKTFSQATRHTLQQYYSNIKFSEVSFTTIKMETQVDAKLLVWNKRARVHSVIREKAVCFHGQQQIQSATVPDHSFSGHGSTSIFHIHFSHREQRS